MNRRVNLLVITFLIFAGIINGQNLTTSPYSFFGIGDIEQYENGQTAGFGGTGIGIQNKYHLNLKNPASYASFDSLSFKFEFGAKARYTNYSTNLQSASTDDYGLSFIAIGFPITKKWHSTLALLPMSSVGYQIKEQYEDNVIGEAEFIYTGEGGLNQLLFGNSFKINNNFSIGLNTTYTFGKLSYYKALIFSSMATGVNTIYENKLNVKGFSYQAGIQYNTKIQDKYRLSAGIIFTNQNKLSVDAQTLAATTYENYSDFIFNATIHDTIYDRDEKGDMLLPTKIGAGVSFTDDDKFLVALDYNFQKWKDYELLGENPGLENYSKISGGLEYTPFKNHPKFFKRLNYRFGGNYANTYLTINNTQLVSYGVNVGIGIPVRRTKTSYNINFEYGQRGTTDNNLIKENYAIISLTLSLSDIWFYKRKYD